MRPPFGLDRPAIVDVATRLVPELFYALAVAEEAERQLAFPITSADALVALALPTARYDVAGVQVEEQELRSGFIDSLFPIEDAVDLVTKTYIVLSGARVRRHDERAAAFLASLRQDAAGSQTFVTVKAARP